MHVVLLARPPPQAATADALDPRHLKFALLCQLRSFAGFSTLDIFNLNCTIGFHLNILQLSWNSAGSPLILQGLRA